MKGDPYYSYDSSKSQEETSTNMVYTNNIRQLKSILFEE